MAEPTLLSLVAALVAVNSDHHVLEQRLRDFGVPAPKAEAIAAEYWPASVRAAYHRPTRVGDVAGKANRRV